ncbi:MAG: ABC transporter ATP-binding protein [Thermoanaerobaculia bacterium]
MNLPTFNPADSAASGHSLAATAPPARVQPLLALENVSLRYRLAKQRLPSFKDYAIHWVKGTLTYESFWALTEVGFEVARGEVIGVVGRNGAGKSSLLKVISGILEPTSGSVRFDGRIAPILELGTGFDHELTGRENIFLNGMLLGRTRKEIRERLDSIIEYSELGDFIESPIRAYSSGMLGRLGFSIASAWTPDLLILDEVFAAGDAGFTRKCEKTIANFRDAGVTILLVSHSAQIVLETCSRALWLERGRLVADGKPDEVVPAYDKSTYAV